ncbi:glycosyltransferase [Stutzerimonas balearica]|uniref:glycosyltransferase n=1 Tax=Stutzerimonas balearica TaxID=74829 RepID=UPI002899E663|nr:glycosyltransferase [Stutzerimonas balearica]
MTLLTSRFRHFDKKHRTSSSFAHANFKIILVDEPGYKANVGLARLYSHSVFCENFRKFFEADHDFDLVYSAYPLIQTNIALGRLKRKFGFKLIIDVQDVWPEAISAVVPVLSRLHLNLLPFTRKANKAYRAADALVAVSKTYMARALLPLTKKVPHEVVYLGSSIGTQDFTPIAHFSEEIFRLGYLGTLSHSYDVETVMVAVSELLAEGYKIELHILGGGPFEKRLRSKGYSGVIFHGFVDFNSAVEFIRSCQVAVNPIASGAPQSVTNKLSDYLALGIPLINSQKSLEVLDLLQNVDHENYDPGSVRSFKSAFAKIYCRRKQLRFRPSSYFDRDVEYKRIERLISTVLEA